MTIKCWRCGKDVKTWMQPPPTFVRLCLDCAAALGVQVPLESFQRRKGRRSDERTVR